MNSSPAAEDSGQSVEHRLAPPRSRLQDLVRHARGDLLLRNSVYIMATTAATSFLGYVYWTVAARRFQAYDIGLASALISAMMLTSNLSNLGLGSVLVQVLPRRSRGRDWSLAFNAALAVGSATALAAGAVAMLSLPLFSADFAVVRQVGAFATMFVLGVLLWTICTLLDAAFVAERVSSNMLARNVVFAVVKIPLLLVPLLPGGGAVTILTSWIVASAGAALVGFLLTGRLKRDYGPAISGVAVHARGMSTLIAGNHFINIGGMAPMYLLPVLVAGRLSPTDNAYFYTTWMLGGLFFMISPAVATSLFAEGSHRTEGMARKTRASALLIAALLLPVAVVLVVAGPAIMSVFGPDYAEHGFGLLLVLLVSSVPDAITSVYVSVLRVFGHMRLAALLNVGMAAVALASAWFLLPLVGITGVGWAWLIAQAVGTAVGVSHLLSVQSWAPRGRFTRLASNRQLALATAHRPSEVGK